MRRSPLACGILTLLSLSKGRRDDQGESRQHHQSNIRKPSNHRRFSSQHKWDVEVLAELTLSKRARTPLCFKWPISMQWGGHVYPVEIRRLIGIFSSKLVH